MAEKDMMVGMAAQEFSIAQQRSSYIERKGNALASGADERRDKLR